MADYIKHQKQFYDKLYDYMDIPKNFTISMCGIAVLVQCLFITEGGTTFIACARIALPVYDYIVPLQGCFFLKNEIAMHTLKASTGMCCLQILTATVTLCVWHRFDHRLFIIVLLGIRI